MKGYGWLKRQWEKRGANVPFRAIIGRTMEQAREAGRPSGANMLGWLSLVLGIGMLGTGRRIIYWLGLSAKPAPLWTMRAIGMREVITGLGILSQSRQPRWIWGRLAGDIVDLGLLGFMRIIGRGHRQRSGTGLGAVAAVTALDLAAALAGSSRERLFHVRKSITVNRTPEEIYRFWRDFENLPQFMNNLEKVETREGGRRSHWVVKAPAGARVEWDAEITEDVPERLIAWRSLEGSLVTHCGVVRFEPGPHGTIVRVELDYRPPAGALGVALARFSGKSAGQQAGSALQHLKQMMETGEIPTIEGQPAGRSEALTKFER